MTIEQLRELMTLDADMNTSDIEERFEQIAKMLFERFAVQKGETKYLFKEIEFYFYSKNHRDIITHPRLSKPLCWYVNDFGGIDLNFASNIKRESIANGKGKNVEKYVLDDNLLTSKQTVEGKVDYILEEYHEVHEKESLYRDFSAFMDRRYRFVRCGSLIHDDVSNVVYFSPWLKDKKEGHSEFYQHLTNLLNRIGIEYKELKSTNDYWARDYMPIQLGENEFLKYRYIIDGGNMVPCGPYIVMTDKVFIENGREKDDADFKTLLESELAHPVIIIPWEQHDDDVYGHSDGCNFHSSDS